MTTAPTTTQDTEEPADQAAPLDALLVDAALGPLRRFAPERVDGEACRPPGPPPADDRPPARRPGRGAGPHRRRHLDASPRPRGTAASPTRRGRDNPLLRRVVQAYLATGQTAEQLVDDAELDWRDDQRVRFLVENLVRGAVAEQRAAAEPRRRPRRRSTPAGLNFVRGGRNLLQRPGQPAARPADGRHVGLRRSAATSPPRRARWCCAPRCFELIQYRAADRAGPRGPAAPGAAHDQQVLRPRPGTGPQPGRVPGAAGPAGVRHVLAQPGRPARRLGPGHLRPGGARRARRGRADLPAPTGRCWPASAPAASSPAIAAAHLAGTGSRTGWPAFGARGHRARPRATPAPPARWSTAGSPPRRPRCRSRRGYLDGRALAEVFAWLRPGDLIWNYWVNNYLLGKKPPAFDILFWNADTTRMPRQAARRLRRPGDGEPARHAAARRPSWACRWTCRRSTSTPTSWPAIADHITPWQSCYRSTQLLGGDSRLRPVDQRPHRRAGQPAGQPEGQLPGQQGRRPPTRRSGSRGATTEQGSWWPDFVAWLGERCGAEKRGARRARRRRPAPLVDAPGTYVFDR